MEISPISLLHHSSPRTLAGLACVLMAGVLAFLGLVGLRFQRRGSARFWAAPAALALCLLPVALGAAFTGLGVRDFLTADWGQPYDQLPGTAAMAAGSAEALMPLLASLFVLVLLVGCAFLTTAIGSARTSGPAGSGLTGWALLASAFATFVLVASLVAVVLWLLARVNEGPMPPRSTLLAWLDVAIRGSFALVVVTLVEAVGGALAAPKGGTGIGIRIASLGALAACGLLAIVGVGMTWSRSLVDTARTGLRDGELPEPHPEPILEEPAATPMPPPPPPPRHDMADQAAPGSAPREATLPSTPHPGGRVYRVGGTIKEPTKLKNVSPVYPELAKQARLSGVVILEAEISPRGDVTSVTVLRGAHPMLDEAAVDAVKQWVYSPTLLNRVPVPVIMTVTVNFKLR